ncbi:MAG TPA: helix-hairpin-helix domain-containing protein [Vicinamibacterales bacterium]|nr:helix-hairpin-helix domain-containing protein [Vicinamibacterales bacterium]
MKILLAAACALAVAHATSIMVAEARQDARPAPLTTFPDGTGKAVAVRLCLDCHPVVDVTRHRESRAGWAAILEKMIGEGASINDADYEALVSYLSVALGKKIKINEVSAEAIAETFDVELDTAAAIVKHRTEHGPFKTWKDVAAVPGIDPKRVEEQKDNLDFSVDFRPRPGRR